MGRAAFLAPDTWTVPRSGTPPSTTILSNASPGETGSATAGRAGSGAPGARRARSLRCSGRSCHVCDDESGEAGQVSAGLGAGEPGLEAYPWEGIEVPLVHLQDQRAAGV